MRGKGMLAMMVAVGVGAATFAVALPGPAFADTSTSSGIAAALNDVDRGDSSLIVDAAHSVADADSAAQNANIDIPVDPAAGIKLTSTSGQKFSIGLPNADVSKRGAKMRSGAVAYNAAGGSANAVVPTKDGVQFLTTIHAKKAPTSYAYPISLPQGGRVVVSPDGMGAAILDGSGMVMAGVPAPWAKDANGRDVATHFTTDGSTLTQHVAHTAKGVAYPVVADPIVIWLMGVTVYCFIAGSYEARNLRGQPWYVWVWGLFLACLPL